MSQARHAAARKHEHPLSALITEDSLRQLAGERYFARGKAYYADGAVIDLVDTGRAVKARVSGTDDYAVKLEAAGRRLVHTCSCPLGEEGEFCKHVVAAGLAWLAQRGSKPGATAMSGPRDLDAIRSLLTAKDKEDLVNLLLEQTENDPALRSRLAAQAARQVFPGDTKALKDTVRKALAVHGFVDYRGMRRVLVRAATVPDLLAGLIEDGHAQEAAELAAYAMRVGLRSYGRLDDSGGSFGDLLRQIAETFLRACRAAHPSGPALAKDLFKLQLADHWGFFDFDDYAPLLGDEGVAAYRALARKEWAKVPARGPGEGRARLYDDHFVITQIMERLARRDGDTGALVAIKSRNLTHPSRFLEIAEVLQQAGRRDEALDWAERGLSSSGEEMDGRLVEFIVAEYHRRRRHDDALALVWKSFARYPRIYTYQQLKESAEKARAWPQWRSKALSWIREHYVPALKRKRAPWPWQPGGHSLLVEVFLREDDPVAALKEAKEGGCTEGLWLELAQALEKESPAEAIAIYQARLDGIVDQKTNDAYDEGAALVDRIRKLMRKTKQEKEFAAWLEDVRTRHKAKRNFMQRLDRALPRAH
jgi:uncharacterized Zn finger protein